MFVSIFAFVIAGAVFLECLLRRADFFSPERLYIFFHSVALGISFLGLHEAMTPFQPLTSLVYFGSAATFILGVWAVKLAFPVPAAPRFPDFSGYDWNRHFGFALFLFFVFAGGMVLAFLGTGAFPMLAEDKGKAVKAFFAHRFSTSVAISYGGLVAFLFFMGIFRPGTSPFYKRIPFWMTVFALLFYSLALSRSGQVFFVFAALLFYHYGVKRLSMGKLSLWMLILASLIFVTGYQKSASLAERYGLKTAEVFQIAMTIPYIYFANNFWNLDYALNPEEPHPGHPPTRGFIAASGILDLAYFPGGPVAGGLREAGGFDDQFNKTSIKVKGLNTISYQWGLYKDFGLAGPLGGGFLIGVLLGFMYVRLRRNPTVLNVAAYAFLGYFIAMSMFVYFPETFVYIYGYAYLLGAVWFCRKLTPLPTGGDRGSLEAPVSPGSAH